MKRICVFTNTLASGGAEKQSLMLANTLKDKYSVWLVVFYGEFVEKKFADFIDRNQIRQIRLSGSILARLVSFFKFIRQNKIDVIFSYLLTTNLIGGVVGKAAGVKYTIGGIRSSKLDKNKIFLQKMLQNYVNNYTIYNNYRGLAILSDLGFTAKKALVIPNFLSIQSAILKRPTNDVITILSVGRFHEAKDYETAIKAISALSTRFERFQYIIIGYGSLEKEIREWVEIYNVDRNVSIVVNPPNLADYYYSADIYLLTSIFEGLSNTVLEAMDRALPLVVTNVGDNDRLVKNGVNGFLCRPKNVDEIANSLLILCTKPEMRREYGTKSHQILKENFSQENFEQSYIQLIESLSK
jgi:glycosyltransferase involved in cell wall biosynthesis